MKWPHTLTFIRHGESEYNALKLKKQDHVDYVRFCELFDRDFAKAKDENWPSEELKVLTKKVWHATNIPMSDYNTPLTKIGFEQAKKVGKNLKKHIEFPDAIYVSPYLRTRQTFAEIKKEWPELKKVTKISEERIREQEHGLSTVFNDWRIYNVMNPLQGLLYKLEGGYEYRFLNGESKSDVRDRVRDFLGTIVRERANENVLVISHHLTILSFRANLEHWDREQFMHVNINETPINCGVTIYKGNPHLGKEGKLLLESYNKKIY